MSLTEDFTETFADSKEHCAAMAACAMLSGVTTLAEMAITNLDLVRNDKVAIEAAYYTLGNLVKLLAQRQAA